MFEPVFSDTVIGRARKKGLISLDCVNIRDYAEDSYKSVDDYPYGGGPGMVLTPGPVSKALKGCMDRRSDKKYLRIFFTPQGEVMTNSTIKGLLEYESLILLCGRYRGVDQRVREKYIDLELSIGDFVLSGGEIPAMALIDSVSRFVPGVLGNQESAEKDSFNNCLLSWPQYTRPEEFEGMEVPEVLLSGNHKRIKEWKEAQALSLTKERRPDLLE